MSHKHEWTVYLGSGFGQAAKLRICGCGRQETLMFEQSKKQWIWVEGNFFEDLSSPIFIVAASEECYKQVLFQIPKDTLLQSLPRVWSQADLETMKQYRRPRFLLARDWKDADISDTDEFRTLMMTGHL